MKSRFTGSTAARRNLVETLKGNRLVEHDEALANRLADEGDVVEFLVTDTIIQQGMHDRDLYLILFGDVRIFVNGRRVGSRGPHEMIGEMALIDATVTRSATVVPDATSVIVLKVSEVAFQGIADDFPRMFRPIAESIAARLRERAKFHRAPNATPLLFIGSSVEGLDIANRVHSGFTHDNFNSLVWTHGVFGPSRSTLEVLMQQAKEADFAAFIFGPDDKITSRSVDYDAPRDNIIFEMGLFLNELGRDRTFIIKERDADLKIPTDLLGVTPIQYRIKDPKYITSAIHDICIQLKDVITVQGVR